MSVRLEFRFDLGDLRMPLDAAGGKPVLSPRYRNHGTVMPFQPVATTLIGIPVAGERA